MFKKLYIIICLLIAGSAANLAMAQLGVYRTACETDDRAVLRQLPAHLCDCIYGDTIAYDLDTTINGETWMNVPISMLDKGMTVYWIGSGAMTFEVFLSCTFKTPVLAIKLNKRGSYIYSQEDIVSKFDSVAKIAKVNWRDTTIFGCPHLHLKPEAGATGRFYYNREMVGPHSTCNDDLWPLGIPMQYVISDPDDIYELEPTTQRKKPFIVWQPKHEKDSLTNLVTLTLLNACQGGQIVAQKTIRSAPYVWVLDSLQMDNYYNTASLFLMVQAQDTGLVTMYNTSEYERDTMTLMLDNEHRKYRIGERWVNHEGYFNDTTWAAGSKLHVRTYKIEFDESDPSFSIWSTLLTNCMGPNRVGQPIHLSACGQFSVAAYDKQGTLIEEQTADYEHTLHFAAPGTYTLKLVSSTGTKTNIKIKINN